ncbi:MAG TPA: S-methyl-5-thioribose-1-phosphate isomerase [Candidatus Thermoplasmatota archaeon]|nr:S-methyl-5-thioribose-1-phosphate isomerase [Candidatus Thermoplasmatota archaeon]
MDRSLASMAEDIRSMRVRGAGKIGRYAAEALAVWESDFRGENFARELERAAATLMATRPSAVSLMNAVAFVVRRARGALPRGEEAARQALRVAAKEFSDRSEKAVAAIGAHGADRLREGGRYLTHCNSQAALAVFREGARRGLAFEVFATETRPWRQGLLTTKELVEAGIATTYVVDSAVLHLMPTLDGVFVGADTVAMNGDVVNKVGTSAVALAARAHGKPFRVCAETYKVDLASRAGRDVPIEERESAEVAREGELAPGVRILNPVFDVTPAAWIAETLTELGPAAPATVGDLARKTWEL